MGKLASAARSREGGRPSTKRLDAVGGAAAAWPSSGNTASASRSDRPMVVEKAVDRTAGRSLPGLA